MEISKLRAGAGKAEIIFPQEMFPTDMLAGVHDNPCARILVMDNGVRVAIASLEMVNVEQNEIHAARKTIEELTGKL